MSAATGTGWVDGRHVVVTGATSGIGRAAACELARRGARISVIGRNQAKLADLVAQIEHDSPGAGVQTFLADLADLEQTRSVAAVVAAQVPAIDEVILNAGVSTRTSRQTAEGFDEMLAANYLGPFVLIHLLMANVKAAAPARIVVTGSDAHRFAGRLDPASFESMGTYGGFTAQLRYGRTKLLDVLMADELARRLPAAVTVNSFCPGLVSTGLTREIRGADRVGAVLSGTPLVRTPAQGARMLLYLADSLEVSGITGRFWSSTPGGNRLRAVAVRRDPSIARRVYERTCELTGVEPI